MPSPDPHTQSEVSSHKLNPDPRPKSNCAVCTFTPGQPSGYILRELQQAITHLTTPPPTPPASSGGEWTTRENLLIRGDNFCANASDTATARDLAQRLNAADAMERALTMGQTKQTPEFLQWVADRLVNVYGENPNVDFVLSLRERAAAMTAALRK